MYVCVCEMNVNTRILFSRSFPWLQVGSSSSRFSFRTENLIISPYIVYVSTCSTNGVSFNDEHVIFFYVYC